MSSLTFNTIIIKRIATELGFDTIGISKARYLEEEAQKLEDWLRAGYQGNMSYMENHFDLRLDPAKLVPGAKSVISLTYNYATSIQQVDASAPKISKYAHGEDYHEVIRKKLKQFLTKIRTEIGEVSGRCFVDSAPVMERQLAEKSGVGWIGKNSLLIHPKKGSYYFLAELIIDLELEVDAPIQNYCGTCTKCIDACPTEAISPKGYLIDASKCISYLTIELRDDIPQEFSTQMENWMFGCDICQEVCPWNRFATQNVEAKFAADDRLLNMKKKEWLELTEEVFADIFQKSAVKRTKYQGLKRNIEFLKRSADS